MTVQERGQAVLDALGELFTRIRELEGSCERLARCCRAVRDEARGHVTTKTMHDVCNQVTSVDLGGR